VRRKKSPTNLGSLFLALEKSEITEEHIYKDAFCVIVKYIYFVTNLLAFISFYKITGFKIYVLCHLQIIPVRVGTHSAKFL
jgi:hypothetical protein